MRTFVLLTLAASAALVPAAASAQAGPQPGVTWRQGSWHRIQRGHAIPPYWFGPQFHINNWRGYGFADPGDGRWVRYYDDAYLIDRGGRVLDTREGLDWDQYGERWEMRDGIPAYYGRNEYQPGDEDYAWAAQQPGGLGGESYAGGYGPYRGGGGYYTQPMIIDTIVTGNSVRTLINGELVDEVLLSGAAVASTAAPVRRPPRPSAMPPRPLPRRAAPPAPPVETVAPVAPPPPAAPPPRPVEPQTPGI